MELYVKMQEFESIQDELLMAQGENRVLRDLLKETQREVHRLQYEITCIEIVGSAVKPEAGLPGWLEETASEMIEVSDSYQADVYILKRRYENQNNIYIYKIGYSTQTEKRVKNIRYEVGDPSIELIHRIGCYKAWEANSFERKLHQTFASKRVHGEWFLLSDEDVAWLLTLDKPEFPVEGSTSLEQVAAEIYGTLIWAEQIDDDIIETEVRYTDQFASTSDPDDPPYLASIHPDLKETARRIYRMSTGLMSLSSDV